MNAFVCFFSYGFLGGIKSVSEFLHKTKDIYNNTSVDIHLKNKEGHLIIDPENDFLQDVVRYTSSGTVTDYVSIKRCKCDS